MIVRRDLRPKSLCSRLRCALWLHVAPNPACWRARLIYVAASGRHGRWVVGSDGSGSDGWQPELIHMDSLAGGRHRKVEIGVGKRLVFQREMPPLLGQRPEAVPDHDGGESGAIGLGGG